MNRPWNYTPPAEGQMPPASLFSPGDRPCQYAGARSLVRWAQVRLQVHGLDQDANAISEQLNRIGFNLSRDSVQHQLDRQIVIPHRPTPPDPNAPPPPVMPAANASPVEVVTWLLGDIPKAASRWPGVSDVFRRSRIRGYNLTWAQITEVLPAAEAAREVSQQQVPTPVEPCPTLPWKSLVSPRSRSQGNIPVHPADAPEFQIGTEWVDPEHPRTSDSRTLFVRVWGVGRHIMLASLAVSRGGQNRVIDQGIVLTRHLRRRLQPRTR